MRVTINHNEAFYKVEAKNENGKTLLNNFLDGVVEVKELFYKQYSKYLNITLLAEEV